MTTTIASIIVGLLLAGATTVGVIHSVSDSTSRPTPDPLSGVVPYGTN